MLVVQRGRWRFRAGRAACQEQRCGGADLQVVAVAGHVGEHILERGQLVKRRYRVLLIVQLHVGDRHTKHKIRFYQYVECDSHLNVYLIICVARDHEMD